MLLPAYDDAQGVTAAFNLNLLHRINRELGGSAPVDAFRHLVRWNDAEARIEMHLQAVRDVYFAVQGRHFFFMAKGETIYTENSLKYGPRDASVLLRAGGWGLRSRIGDPEEILKRILIPRASVWLLISLGAKGLENCEMP